LVINNSQIGQVYRHFISSSSTYDVDCKRLPVLHFELELDT